MSRIFTCAGCHAALTVPLRALPAALDLGSRGDRCNEVAGGCFLVDPERDRPDHPVTINPGDARGLRLHPDLDRSQGCCGLAFRNGQENLCCARCGVEVGMVMADGDHAPHCVHLRDHGPEVPGVGPSDAQLLARSTRLGELAVATAWSTMFPPALTGDDRWIDDIDVVAPRLPVLRTFAVELDRGAAGTRLILRLDGHEVVPPWPSREVAWIAALGRVPSGSAVLMWQTWLPVQLGGERWEHAGLESPGEGTMLCAVWWRQIAAPERGNPEQVLGFRVPLQLWDEAFAAATASLDR